MAPEGKDKNQPGLGTTFFLLSDHFLQCRRMEFSRFDPNAGQQSRTFCS
jgi:hypothetical protein